MKLGCNKSGENFGVESKMWELGVGIRVTRSPRESMVLAFGLLIGSGYLLMVSLKSRTVEVDL